MQKRIAVSVDKQRTFLVAFIALLLSVIHFPLQWQNSREPCFQMDLPPIFFIRSKSNPYLPEWLSPQSGLDFPRFSRHSSAAKLGEREPVRQSVLLKPACEGQFKAVAIGLKPIGPHNYEILTNLNSPQVAKQPLQPPGNI